MFDAAVVTNSDRCFSYNELVGVSSQVFLPDGTPLRDEPLVFDDPPRSPLSKRVKPEDLIRLRSEEISLDGRGVHVISVPWGPEASIKDCRPSPREAKSSKQAKLEKEVLIFRIFVTRLE